MIPEEWKPCLGGNYAISNHGRFKRLTPGRRTWPGRIIKLQTMTIGYHMVGPTVFGKNKNTTIHSLVAEHFIGPRPDGMEVNHIDGCKTNNVVTNLEYVTHAENIQHARDMGLVGSNRTHDDAIISAVREDRTSGMSFMQIAKKYGISLGYAYTLCDGTSSRARGMGSIVGEKQKPKLTADQVIEMRERRASGERCDALAAAFGVSQTQVSAICCGHKWKSAGGPLTQTKGLKCSV